MKRLLIFLILSNFAISCKRDIISLDGKILYRETKIGLSKTRLQLLKSDGIYREIETDENGYFKFDSIRKGNYTLRIWKVMYGEKRLGQIDISKSKHLMNIIFPDSCIVSKNICPKNSNDTVIPIVYGLPSAKTEKKYIDGKVEFGGCSKDYCAPNWYCKKHKLRF